MRPLTRTQGPFELTGPSPLSPYLTAKYNPHDEVRSHRLRPPSWALPPNRSDIAPPRPHTPLPLSCMHDKGLRPKLATHHDVLHVMWHLHHHLLLICGHAAQCEAGFCAGHAVLRLQVIAALIDLMINLQIKPACIIAVCLQACKLSWQSWSVWDLTHAFVLSSLLCLF